jgi:hypothetical protein
MSKPKTFRPWLPGQIGLLPPSPSDWLPKDHLAFFLLDLIDQLDLDPIFRLYRQHALQKASRALQQGHCLHKLLPRHPAVLSSHPGGRMAQ